MRVYHGTILSSAMDICNNGIDLNKSKKYLDFGKGFYTSTDYEMAKNVAIKVCLRENIKNNFNNIYPSVITFEYIENQLLNIKKFEKEDVEWARYIMFNRLTTNISYKLGLTNYYNNEYDIVIGGTSDGNIARIANDLRMGKIDYKDFKYDLSNFFKDDGTSYGTQITFKTDKSLSCIEYVKYDTILYKK